MSADHHIAGWLAGLESWIVAGPGRALSESLGNIEFSVGDAPELKMRIPAPAGAAGGLTLLKVLNSAVLIQIINGETGWQQAFLDQQVSIKGDPTAATALSVLLGRYATERLPN